MNKDPVTIGDWMQRYLDYSQIKHSEKTYKEKRSTFKRFFQFLKDKELNQYSDMSEITIILCLEYLQIQYVERSGYAANKDRKNISAAYTWLTKYLDYYSVDNPFERIDKFPEIKKLRYIPPVADFWKVYNACDNPQDKLMLITFLYTAGRRGELFRLTWSDINFEQNTIALKTMKREQGNYEIDMIPLHENLKQELLDWKNKQPIKQEYVFLCITTNQVGKPHQRYGKPFVTRHTFMKKICNKAGVKPFDFHAIRHLTATVLYHNGSKPSVVQLILRHKNASTTEKYLHSLGLNNELKAEFNSNMPDIFNNQSAT